MFWSHEGFQTKAPNLHLCRNYLSQVMVAMGPKLIYLAISRGTLLVILKNKNGIDAFTVCMGKLPTLKVFRTLATSPNLLETAGECSGYITAILQTPVDLSSNESPGS